jgi:enoyl-CoA hydratase
MAEDLVLIDREGAVGLVRLNRPDKLNALSPDMLSALADALDDLDADEDIRVIVITGNERAFAAGADIEAMSNFSSEDVLRVNTRQYWLRMWRVGKPLIAAVSGFAFGGGCELALQCDLIVASETAKFAQPEIKLGVMPGAGGTQRLAKAIGPYRAMEMERTGEPITAQQAFEANLVNRVVPVERYLDEAMELARLIAARPPIAVRRAREAFKQGLWGTMQEGMDLERENFVSLFDTEDQKEGMAAFLEKRPPQFRGK